MVEGTLKMMDPKLIQHFNHFKNLLQDLLVVVESLTLFQNPKTAAEFKVHQSILK